METTEAAQKSRSSKQEVREQSDERVRTQNKK